MFNVQKSAMTRKNYIFLAALLVYIITMAVLGYPRERYTSDGTDRMTSYAISLGLSLIVLVMLALVIVRRNKLRRRRENEFEEENRKRDRNH
ncbi:Uncharacterised protein [Porphyromonas macacae]|uniref:Uncharacterized protein n=2 Tax=Porphyromonas macacae TaxID=28115 RepID=A0A379DHZ0_9PORP|nr:Uncharacterised protein [Porphyromonas macacae]